MGIVIKRLRVESLDQPLGLETKQPRFSWLLDSEEQAQQQSAYRILVASNADLLQQDIGDCWDSGEVVSDRSVQVSYLGSLLQSGLRYYWKVQVWDAKGAASEWSSIGYWTMGILDPNEWKGEWIGQELDPAIEFPPGLYLRKEFVIDRPVRQATLYATALGVYELHLNGSRVGDEYFAPGWTDYAIRTQYQTYDITASLQAGGNAFGAILGTGWYAGQVGMMGREIYGTSPALLLQLDIQFEDGTNSLLITDETWAMNTGPIQYSDMLKGEAYDARKELPDWDRTGFDDSDWKKVNRFEPYTGKLVSQIDPPVRITESINPVKMWLTKQGTHLFDMGQNMVGWVKLQVQGQLGTHITVRHAEMLQDEDTLYIENLRRADQKEIYILKGEGLETFEPHFTFHGFRYVEIEGVAAGELTLESIIGRVVHSDTPGTGSLETSDDMVNRLISNIRWGQRGNYLSVPTDCPQRDERLGWTGDAQIFIRTASYNMDVSRFFAKFMEDMTDGQTPDGAFPDVAPDAGWFEFKQEVVKWFAPDNAGWGDAGVIIPWTLYLMYEDRTILETNYDAMKRWVEYLKTNSTDRIRPDYANYGDWLSINADTPKDVLATAYFAYSTALFVRIARVLGYTDDVSEYSALFEEIRTAFVHTYMDKNGIIQGDTQTVYVLALYFGLLSEEQKPLAVKRLEELIRENGNHLSTGFLGVGYLLPVLTENGLDELAYSLLHQDTFPSWLYSVKQGATTIWERWDGWTEEAGFQNPGMNSFNHYSLGSVGEWMYRYMAGIDVDTEQPGFKHIVIHPRPGGKLTYVKATVESSYGAISSSWQLNGERFSLQVSIPVNTTATIYLDGTNVLIPDGAVEIGLENGKHKYRIGSGNYEFISQIEGAVKATQLT
ncbi:MULTISPECIES: family 78 glycoside hydrolase catalytic domain [unclassified Paenibacillus]|uniref:family 78 glycoside hydrolase catalytic domain n=1 Tax=unclassified Paenibacillus TaxID=185978 RepID=UPI0036276C18